MTKRLIAIAVIFIFASFAWLFLSLTIHQRTQDADSRLRARVGSTWGIPHQQAAPAAYHERVEVRTDDAVEVPVARPDQRRTPGSMPATAIAPAQERSQLVRVRVPLSLESTRANVGFNLEHRQKGLMWYSTYTVAFSGTFGFRNTTSSDSAIVEFPLPAAQAIYDDLRVTINGSAARYRIEGQSIRTSARVAPGDSIMLGVSYRSQGLDSWRYVLGREVAEVKDFELVMRTDFDRIDFPENTLSPTARRAHDDGWELEWKYANLLSGFQIGMDMPQKLQPGPLAGKISMFAPVSLLFFFAVMFIIVTLRRIELHPMNYAFLAAAFFAFHLLLAYLVDHISIHAAFLIASGVSIALVVSYMRLAVGPAFAFREAALAQFIYLVLFSYAFFFEGFTGLAITIGSVLTLFVAMQLTGRIRWSEVFSPET